MIVTPCPRCHEPIRLPSESFPDDAVGRCPWCRESFPAAEVLRGLPPALEVTSADGQPIAGSPPEASAETAWTGAAGLEALEPSWPQPGFGTEPPENDLGVEPIAPMRVSPGPASPHARHKRGSKLRTLVGVALGPVIALPLAGGILLALGRAPDLGFYPFDGTYSHQSPLRRSVQPVGSPSPEATAPQHHRETIEPPSPTPADRASQGRSLAPDLAEQPSGDAEPDPTAQVLEELVASNTAGDEADAAGDEADAASHGADAAGDEADPGPMTDAAAEIDSDAEPTPPAASTAGDAAGIEPGVGEPTGADGAAEADGAAPADANAPPDETDPKSMPAPGDNTALDGASTAPGGQRSGESAQAVAAAPDEGPATAELARRIDAASAHLAELTEADLPDDRRRRVLARAYAALARVGAAATPADRPAVAPLLRRVEQARLDEDFGAAAPKWLDFADRPHPGAVLVGRLSEQNTRWHMTLDSGRRVAIEIPEGVDAADAPQRVLGLGTIESSDDGQSVRLSILSPLSGNAP